MNAIVLENKNCVTHRGFPFTFLISFIHTTALNSIITPTLELVLSFFFNQMGKLKLGDVI